MTKKPMPVPPEIVEPMQRLKDTIQGIERGCLRDAFDSAWQAIYRFHEPRTELSDSGFNSERFPLKEQPIKGMVCSLPGVLNRAAEHCHRSRDSNNLSFPLGELLRHINHLRASESDEQALERLEQFLRMWVE